LDDLLSDDLAIFSSLASLKSRWIMSRGRGRGNLRAIQLLLGHAKLESTVCYLGIEVDDALSVSKQVEL